MICRVHIALLLYISGILYVRMESVTFINSVPATAVCLSMVTLHGFDVVYVLYRKRTVGSGTTETNW